MFIILCNAEAADCNEWDGVPTFYTLAEAEGALPQIREIDPKAEIYRAELVSFRG